MAEKRKTIEFKGIPILELCVVSHSECWVWVRVSRVLQIEFRQYFSVLVFELLFCFQYTYKEIKIKFKYKHKYDENQ